MAPLTALYRQTDVGVTDWMARRAVPLLRCSLGVVFFWFGVLKFIPDFSPAADLAARTMTMLSFGLVAPGLLLPGLAAWECLIGLGLLSGTCLRATLLLLLLQMVGTLTPLLLFPTLTFTRFPFAPTLEGQYIIKNLVLISAALVIGALVRGGRVIADPEVVRAWDAPASHGPAVVLCRLQHQPAARPASWRADAATRRACLTIPSQHEHRLWSSGQPRLPPRWTR